jgi:methyl-accepting chemotaxis protein
MAPANELVESLNFVGFNGDSAEALRDFYKDIEALLPDVLTMFYEHLSGWPNLNAMFSDQKRRDHAKHEQHKHWLKLFKGTFDADYAASVKRIGLVHSRVGLEPSWYIGAYSFVLSHFYRIILHGRINKRDGDKMYKLIKAINQCVMIDMEQAISVYIAENKKTYQEKLNNLSSSFESSVADIVTGVSSATIELEASANSLSKTVATTSLRAASVASASEEASSNAANVAAASEEMAASIKNLSSLANESAKVAKDAVCESVTAVQAMQTLQNAVGQISEVVDLISGISKQTNLLALNATIEAARAGEAGKGFSVVAAEVKSLATQTGQATEDIRKKINEIEVTTKTASDSLGTVQKIINHLERIADSTSDSIVQQNAVVGEISANIQQTAGTSKEINKNINDISGGAAETGNAASMVLDTVKELARQTEAMRSSVQNFITTLKKEAA